MLWGGAVCQFGKDRKRALGKGTWGGGGGPQLRRKELGSGLPRVSCLLSGAFTFLLWASIPHCKMEAVMPDSPGGKESTEYSCGKDK